MINFTAVESIFFAALEKSSGPERAAFLKEVCGHDAELRQHVERMLGAHPQAASFLNAPVLARIATVDEPPVTEGPGTRIGPYKLLQQIGEGGMGVVYMAEQEQPLRRRVALKIIKPGMDSKQVIARFEAERQALALMEHQNIAKVLDAGATDSGRPYFVMELVHGVPITQYCDDHHLTPKQRLELFLPVCHAVQHAHQKGIIHRDLKPSNVLVCLYDGVAVPKVIDFGVAKATGQPRTERTLFTQFGSLVGTLEYMSPEQAEMSQLGIDTRSDVYALGVLLYELLTGTTPLERPRLREAGFDEIRRLIREEEPPRPSTRLSTSGVALAAISAQRQTEPAKLTRLVRGELDWIVMRCLEKDRTRRYETASTLARDVERYLHDEPVEACPPTAGYKLRKFARKHKAGLATAAGFAALLVLGTVVSAWQAVRATQAEAVALANEQQANANAAQAEKKEHEANQQRDDAQRQRDEVRALNEQLRRTTYTAHMNLAQHTWEAGDIGRVRELLEQHRPKPGESELHSFEWYYLDRLCHAEILTLKGAGAGVAYSPDGKRLASAAGDGIVKLWDAQSGQELLTLKGHSDRVGGVAFSPDGKRLASASADKTVKLWDAQRGQELLTLRGHTGPADHVAYSPDGKRLASSGFAWDYTKRAYASGGVKIWDAQTGQELLSIKGYSGSVTFSPDGKRLAGAMLADAMGHPEYTAKLWDAQTGQELLALKDVLFSVAFSPDGTRLASGTLGGTVKVRDAQTGQELLSLKGHRGQINSVAFSPDGKRLASAGWDRIVRVWDARSGQELLTCKGHTGMIGTVGFSPDGTRLASAGGGTVKIWDATTSPEARTLAGPTGGLRFVVFSPDGKRLAGVSRDPTTNERAVKVWEAQTGQELLSLKGASGRAAFSPDGKRLASGSGDKTVKVWDAQTGQELLTCKGHTDQVGSVAFSPDGKRLASTARGGEIKVWNAQTGQEIFSLKYTGQSGPVAFSPDGKRLASVANSQREQGKISSLGEVKMWDAQTGQELLTWKVNNGAGFRPSLAFSPDGKRLATSSQPPNVFGPGPGEFKVWDTQTGQELLTLKGHPAPITSVAFSPDGKRLASAAGWDGTVKLWDAQTGQELLNLKVGGNVNSLAYSPDGHWLASDPGGTVTIWDATPLPEKR